MDQKNNSKTTGIIIAVIIVVLIIIVMAMPKKTPNNGTPAATTQTDQTTAITSQVEAFGSQMELVSLLAPSDALKTSMENAYGQYATSDAIAKWEADPSDAPGRLTSSPWPDHIDVTNVLMTSDTGATVQGNVVELTSNEVEHGGVSDQYPVTITMVQQNGTWLVSDFEKNSSQ